MAEGVPAAAEDQTTSVVEDITGAPSFAGRLPEDDPMKVAGVPRPENVPEKFWDSAKGAMNTEALLKSYAELEKRFSAKSDEADDAADDAEAAAEDQEEADEAASGDQAEASEEASEESDEAASEDAAPAPLAEAITAAQAVFAETGDIPAEARADLHKLGITDQVIDLQIAGARAYTAALEKAAADAAEAPYEDVQAAIAWAAKGWSAKKIAAFNAQSGDVETIGPAVIGLMRDYRKANPGEGRLTNIHGGTNHGDVYQSRSEFDKDLAAAGNDRGARRVAINKLNRSLQAKTVK